MIIGVCGNGYCGSSAVTDYLRENAEVAVSPYDIEFSFLYDVDAVDDLRHHLVTRPVRYYSSDAAIKRFRMYMKDINSPNSMLRKMSGNTLQKITEEYLTHIIQLTWHGWWHYDVRHADFLTRYWNFRFLLRVNILSERIFHKSIDIYRRAKMHLSIEPALFEQETKSYVQKLVGMFNPNHLKYVALDQPYPVGMSETYRHYFSDTVKTINVIRDPRDVFVAARKVNKAYSSWIPTEKVEDFVTYFRLLSSKKQNGGDNDELTVRFENLIYHYEQTTDQIDEFVGIRSPKSRKYFNPDISINNTQLFRKYSDLSEEIRYIEQELPEYLYDFQSVDRIPEWKDSF